MRTVTVEGITLQIDLCKVEGLSDKEMANKAVDSINEVLQYVFPGDSNPQLLIPDEELKVSTKPIGGEEDGWTGLD